MRGELTSDQAEGDSKGRRVVGVPQPLDFGRAVPQLLHLRVHVVEHETRRHGRRRGGERRLGFLRRTWFLRLVALGDGGNGGGSGVLLHHSHTPHTVSGDTEHSCAR